MKIKMVIVKKILDNRVCTCEYLGQIMNISSITRTFYKNVFMWFFTHKILSFTAKLCPAWSLTTGHYVSGLSVRPSVNHTLTCITSYSAYLIDPLQLNLDNGRSV